MTVVAPAAASRVVVEMPARQINMATFDISLGISRRQKVATDNAVNNGHWARATLLYWNI